MSDVVLIRPGWTVFDEEERVQGALDVPLNDRGEAQVREMIDHLRGLALEAVYAAPCEPVRRTAHLIGAALAVPVKESPGLRNLNQGLWQGLQLREIRQKSPKALKRWQSHPQTVRPPQGEMITEALPRLQQALERPLRRRWPFALVASEPLATLSRSFILADRPEQPGPLCAGRNQTFIEFLDAGRGTSKTNRATPCDSGAPIPPHVPKN